MVTRMPKGKKFDAAEKHFKEKERRLNRLIDVHSNAAKEAYAQIDKLKAENEALKKEMEEVKAINEQLKQLHNLSDDDIKTLLQRSRSLNTFSAMMNIPRF